MTTCCTTLDHIYPATSPGTPCYCGRRTWAGAPATHIMKRRVTGAVKPGARVSVLGQLRTVVEKIHGEDCYRVDEKVSGRTLFERAELMEVVIR